MALVVKDRVLETSNTNGTGTFTLAGAVNGFQAFSVIGVGNTTYYAITEETNNQWEVGLGTVGSGTLTRNTVLSSSNNGNKVDFADGLKQVFCDYPASKAVYKDGAGTIVGLGTMATQNANAVVITGGSVDGTPIGATTASTGAFSYVSTSSTTSTTPTLSFNASNSPFASGATVSGSYLQALLQNKSGTASASTNYVLSNDLGTDSTYYGEFGMNSSVYSSGTPADFFSLNNGVYFSGHDGDVSIGSGNGYKTYLAWGTSGDKAHVINATGAIGLNTNITGTTNFGTSGQMLLSAGSAATPTWSSSPTISGGTIDNTVIGATTPAAGTFNTLIGGKSSTTYVTITGDANYPMIQATGGTNTPLVLSPLGTGALQAQKTDSTATGGNARGANAVDWQTSRGANYQVASGTYGVIVGGTANQNNSFGGFLGSGNSNYVNGAYSAMGGGQYNQVTGALGFVGAGYTNYASGYLNVVVGGANNTGTANAAVTTQSGTMNGTTAVTLSGSNANIKVGQLISGTNITLTPYTYVAAVSGTSLTLSQAASGSSTSTLSFYTPHGVVVGGGNNQATGSYSFIGGGGDAGTAANRNVASGDWSVVAGGFKNTASGLYSSITGGRGNTASGGGATVAGGGTDGSNNFPNTAGGTSSSVGGGINNAANGFGSSVVGGSTNSANGTFSSVVGGSQGIARSIDGNLVFPAANNPLASSQGSQQSALLVLAKQTTDATATVLTSNTSAASGTNQVILPNNSAYYFTGEVVSGVTGGGNTKGWTISGVIKRGANAGATTLVGSTVTSLYADAGAATWTIGLTADTTNGGLAVTFTGQAATTIRVVAQLRTTEMTY